MEKVHIEYFRNAAQVQFNKLDKKTHEMEEAKLQGELDLQRLQRKKLRLEIKMLQKRARCALSY